jgi:eukaryotic-like serine/threonine-protein kinase
MTLSPGTRLGPYDIVSLLGAGGMGEVYRAKDSRLGREVAVKVLHSEVAGDHERLLRFEREARAASALNHPNIITVHDFGNQDGTAYLVTELLSGHSLRAILASGPLSTQRAIDIATAVANGLAAAHERGIVHRDLKPENLFLTRDGVVKILDFGLAKPGLSPGESLESATIQDQLTASGELLGTAAYMSPEQIRGDPVDGRSDLFALGCVLHEMLTGQRTFARPTWVETLTAVLREDATSLSFPHSSTPPVLEEVVRHLLEKRLEDRFQNARDVAFALQLVSRAPGDSAEHAGRSPWGRSVRFVVLVVAAVLVAAAALLVWPRRAPETSYTGDRLLGGSVLTYGARFSPDGETLALAVMVDGLTQLAVMKPGDTRWTVLTHDTTRGAVLNLCWSRDGRLLFYDRSLSVEVRSVPALGGEERTVLEDATRPEALPDGSLLVGRSEADGGVRLYRFWPSEARLEPVGPVFRRDETSLPSTGARVNSKGTFAVFFGNETNDAEETSPGLYRIDLMSGTATRIASSLDFRRESGAPTPPVTIDPSSESLITMAADGDLHVVVSVPLDGTGPPRRLFALPVAPWFLDMGPDGSLLVDQIQTSGEIVRFTLAGGQPEIVARCGRAPDPHFGPLQLPDGRFLLSSLQSGRQQLLAALSGAAPVPFVDTDEPTSGPACLLPDDQVSFVIGARGHRQIALASLDGRIRRRFDVANGAEVTALSPFRDGRTLLVGARDWLWSLSVVDGVVRELVAGASGAVDPASDEVLVLRAAGGSASRLLIAAHGEETSHDLGVFTQIVGLPLPGNAVVPGIGVLITAEYPTSWFVGPALFDLRSGAPRHLPVHWDGDVFSANRARDGSILAIGWEYASGLWRFRPTSGS